jgi:hypothetical protein
VGLGGERLRIRGIDLAAAALPLVACAVALNLTEPLRPTELSIAALKVGFTDPVAGSVLR